MFRVSNVVPAKMLDTFEGFDAPFDVVRIEIEYAERLKSQRFKAKQVVRPQSSSFLFWDFLDEYLAQLGKLLMHTRIAAGHRDNPLIAFQASEGDPEVVQGHFPGTGLIFKQLRTVGAGQIAFVGDDHGDDLH